MDNYCTHKWVHLRSEGTKEIGYRQWVRVELFYCEHCLAYKRIEVDPARGMSY